MELCCRATSLPWANSMSPPSLHFTTQPKSVSLLTNKKSSSIRIFCVNNNNNNKNKNNSANGCSLSFIAYCSISFIAYCSRSILIKHGFPGPAAHVVRHRFLVPACSSNQEGKQMIVSITGATGFIGKRLVQRLHKDNHRVRVLTRSKSKAQLVFPGKKAQFDSVDFDNSLSNHHDYTVKIHPWRTFENPFNQTETLDKYIVLEVCDKLKNQTSYQDTSNDFPGIIIAEEPEWKNSIQGSNAVVNLAGTPISTRWSSEIKKDIKQSRISVTSKVVDLINNSQDDARPMVLVSATAVGYYGTSEVQVFNEQSPSGNDYLAEVCREWESTALKVNKDVRLARIRIGVVLGKDGGALAKMIPLFQLFAGGTLGSGRQWFSWIHLDDIVDLIYEALSNPSYEGVINGTAPNPVRMEDMCKHLGNILGRPSWLPVPGFALKAVLGEGASVILEGQRVLPVRAKELGFSFKYPFLKDALKTIVSAEK